MTTRIDEIKKAVEQAREQYSKTCQTAIQVMFDEVFTTYPQIKTIYWVGFTSYFNDGDPCQYSINDVRFSPSSWENIDGPYYGDEIEDEENGENLSDFEFGYQEDERVSPEMKSLLKKISDLMEDDLLDALKDAYGDHAFIRVYNGGHDVQEYDHD